MSKANQLTGEFITIINNWIVPEDLDIVRKRNREETDPMVCHTHDFCDANMAMEEAIENLSMTSLPDCDKLRDDAWDIAKKRGFLLMDGPNTWHAGSHFTANDDKTEAFKPQKIGNIALGINIYVVTITNCAETVTYMIKCYRIPTIEDVSDALDLRIKEENYDYYDSEGHEISFTIETVCYITEIS